MELVHFLPDSYSFTTILSRTLKGVRSRRGLHRIPEGPVVVDPGPLLAWDRPERGLGP